MQWAFQMQLTALKISTEWTQKRAGKILISKIYLLTITVLGRSIIWTAVLTPDKAWVRLKIKGKSKWWWRAYWWSKMPLMLNSPRNTSLIWPCSSWCINNKLKTKSKTWGKLIKHRSVWIKLLTISEIIMPTSTIVPMQMIHKT